MCDDNEKTKKVSTKLRQVRKWAGVPLNQIGGDTKKRVDASKCIGCGNKMPDNDGVYHDACAGHAKKNVKRDVKHGATVDGLQSSMDINLTNHDKYGRNKLGVRHFGCGCNAGAGYTHGKNCKYAGQRFTDKQIKGLD